MHPFPKVSLLVDPGGYHEHVYLLLMNFAENQLNSILLFLEGRWWQGVENRSASMASLAIESTIDQDENERHESSDAASNETKTLVFVQLVSLLL